MNYYAIRPKAIPDHIRIERAIDPETATRIAFGRPLRKHAWEWKDLGTRVKVIQSDAKRIALLKDPKGWNTL